VRRLVGQTDDRLLRRAAGDHGSGSCGVKDALRGKIVRVSVAGALAGEDADAATDGDALGSGLHHALVERDRGGSLVFEVEVGEVAAGGKRGGKVALDVGLRQTVALEEELIVHSHS